MKTRLFVVLIIVSTKLAFSQSPFTTLSMEPIKVDEEDAVLKTYSFSDEVKKNGALLKAATTTDTDTEKEFFDFFSNSSLSTALIKTSNRVSINSEIFHYKLFIANPDDAKIAAGTRKYRFNIPLLLISKLSTQYDSINSATSWDALDYEAAPFTLRIMPSFKKSFSGFKDVIYYGFYTDLRGLNLYNNETNEYDLEFIGSGGIGFNYEGEGEAGKYNEKGEYKPGKYSLSFMLQAATGKKEILQRLFDTDNNYVTSLQAYFYFKVKEDSSLNLKIGYQYLFQDTLAGAKSSLSLAIGM